MAETDEIAIGAVPEDYSHHMPGFRQRSCGFHARAGGLINYNTVYLFPNLQKCVVKFYLSFH